MNTCKHYACLALMVAASAVHGAGPVTPTYNIGDAVKGSSAPVVTPIRPEPPPAPVISQEADTPLTLSSGQTLFIREFKLEGADFLDPADVETLLAPYRNRALTMVDLQEITGYITALCRQQGYLVARAYLPKQDARDGLLMIKVIAGQYGSFQIQNHSFVDDGTIQSFFDHAKEASPLITQSGLERPMLLIGDLPGAQLPSINITPGGQPGTSDFMVDVAEAQRLTGYATADNYGSRFTGKGRFSAGMDVNSPLGIGDRLSLSGMSTPAAGLQNYRVAYGFPLGTDGLRGELAVSRTTYKLGDVYADLDANGTADTTEATVSYPIKRSREDNITLSVNVAGKRLRDDINATDLSISKRAEVSTVSLQRETYGQLFGLPAYFSLGGSLTLGQLHFDDPTLKAQNQAGADTVGHYSKVNLNLAVNFDLNEQWSLSTSLRMQQSLDKNLDGSEQLSLSCACAIKSYPDGVAGDNGYLFGSELKYIMPTWDSPVGSLDHYVGLFVNYGAVRPKDGSYTTIGEVAISDFGIGYGVTDKTYYGRVQLAQTMGTQKDTAVYNDKLKVLVALGMKF